MATTPPPPSEILVPPTPRHGPIHDAYEPYAPRQSARIASQRRSRERQATPPPSLGDKVSRKQKYTEAGSLSPGSIHNTPQKSQPGRQKNFVPTHSLDNTCDVSDHDDSDLAESDPALSQQPPSQAFRSTLTNGMLPTPAKTPRKKAVGDVSNATRTLFPSSSTSGRNKKGRKATGFSLTDLSDDMSGSRQSKIEIYTDSRDRIPELHESKGNLFYKKPSNTETARKSESRSARKGKTNEKRDEEVGEALKRDDGMFYVFRGKKVFRKFQEDNHEEDDDDDLGLLASRPDLIDSSIVSDARPLDRSSIKPRVLFPSSRSRSSQDKQPNDTDEEAATDIEDHTMPQNSTGESDHNEEEEEEVAEEVPDRPVTPPGTSSRTLLNQDGVDHSRTPVSTTRRKHASPFDGWLRKKQAPTGAISKPKKRDAETTGGPAAKRSRGSKTATVSST